MTTALRLSFVALIAALLTWFALGRLAPQQSASVLAERPTGGDFTLTSASGPVSLSDFRGKVVLVYFGYTFCPDVCPTSLALIAGALQMLDPSERASVRGIFIGVDPERDTPERVSVYASAFDASLVGVTGTPAALKTVARQYGAFYQKAEGQSAGGYLVDHTSYTYVVGPGGDLRTILNHGTEPHLIAAAIRAALPGAARAADSDSNPLPRGTSSKGDSP